MLTDATVASLMVTLVMRVVMVRMGRVTGMKMDQSNDYCNCELYDYSGNRYRDDCCYDWYKSDSCCMTVPTRARVMTAIIISFTMTIMLATALTISTATAVPIPTSCDNHNDITRYCYKNYYNHSYSYLTYYCSGNHYDD
ncbi:hypothetical protein MG293_020770 [Ovis ammon polii]|uniref:Uncharacterized protein n=1 Tax=Ovis ammon polii TaxID=230172 RepID=A0AAD4TM93_OVIAM|nr:hypothetical protein MG293_020770 [Ovis ammon polii]